MKTPAIANAMRSAARTAGNAALTIVLAPTCAACGSVLQEPLAGPVCAECWASIHVPSPPLCTACGDTLPSWRGLTPHDERCVTCRRWAPAIDAGRTAGEYDGALREIIHAFKYEGRRSLAAPLARLLRDSGSEILADADCLVPVPLHPWRRLRRGFNQATDLAARLDLPVVHALWRTRPTRPQTGLDARARHRNMRRAFVPSPRLTLRRASPLAGRVVVLVDDVRTTGATLQACAAVLKRSGARSVRALTVARALIAPR